MTSAPPAGWVHRQRAIAARQRPRCVRCGHKRTVPTELGPLCRAHAVDLPPPLIHPEHVPGTSPCWCGVAHYDAPPF